MKRHCTAACLIGAVFYVGVISPFLECKIHQDCHVHYDEPARVSTSLSGSSSFTSTASLATGSINLGTTTTT